NAVDLATLPGIASPLYRTLARWSGYAADCGRDDRLEEIARLLPRPVIDVEDPLAPQQEASQRPGAHGSELQQSPRANLINRRQWLHFKDALVLQARLVQRCEAGEICVGVRIERKKSLEERHNVRTFQLHRCEWV